MCPRVFMTLCYTCTPLPHKHTRIIFNYGGETNKQNSRKESPNIADEADKKEMYLLENELSNKNSDFIQYARLHNANNFNPKNLTRHITMS